MPGLNSSNILYILSQFPEVHETFILREIQALQKQGVHIRILSLKPCKDKVIHPEANQLIKNTVYGRISVLRIAYGALRKPLKTIAVLFYVFKTYGRSPKDLLKAIYVWLESFYFIPILKEEKVTHIHSHWATMPTTAAMILNKITGIPFSFTAHAWDIFVNPDGLEEKIESAKFVVTCTDYNRKFLTCFCRNGREKKVYLNYHGIDISRFSVFGPLRPQNDKKLKILAIGRLVETKGFEYLIQACRILKDRGVEFECNIVGEGPLKKRLAYSVERLALKENIKFLGIKTQKEIRELFEEATVLAQPSVMARNGDRDGIPNVILEAMALGVPVIATDFSGIPEAIIDKKTGILIPDREAGALADSIVNLGRDSALRLMLAKNGRGLIEDKFAVERNTEGLIRIFQENGAIGIAGQSKRINILHIIWSLGAGGAERALIQLVKGIDKNKFHPFVCCLNDKGIFAPEVEQEGIEVIALNKRGRYDFSVLNKLISIIRKNRIQIVHTHMWGGNLWGRVAARIARVPVIIATEQNVDTWKKPYHLLIDRWLSAYTDKIIVVSGRVKEFYAENARLGPDKIRVIYNSVDLEKYSFNAKGKVNNGWLTLGVIGRLVPQKGHRYFLLALKELIKEHKVKGMIVGAGPIENELRQFSRELGLDGSVTFTGLRQDIPDVLKGIDILVLPSLIEGLPLVALEAMASGVPVVATKAGGNPELITDAQTGILIEPRSHSAIEEAVIRLINDKGLALQLAYNSRKLVEEEFSSAKIVRETQGLYEELHTAKARH